MIPKSGTRFSEMIVLIQEARPPSRFNLDRNRARGAGTANRISTGPAVDLIKIGNFCTATLANPANLAKLYAVTKRCLIPVQGR
jgi:hypothetical protein